MPNNTKSKRKSNAGRKPGPAGKLLNAGALFVTEARYTRLIERWLLTGQSVSQQAAAALDVADPLPPPEARP